MGNFGLDTHAYDFLNKISGYLCVDVFAYESSIFCSIFMFDLLFIFYTVYYYCRRAQMLANNSRGPILRASGHERLFSSTALTCSYTKYRYNNDASLLLDFIWYEGLRI